MKVKIETAKKMLEEILRAKGADSSDIDWLVELSLDQDLTGNYFSGLEVGPEGIYDDASRGLNEIYEVDGPSLKLINGNGKPAKLIMKNLIPKAIGWTKEHGQIVVGFKNCGYHSNLGTIARKFAESDLLCIYSSNGGPSTVPPFGGSIGLFGTNPLAYGIPTSGDPIVFDAATSERPWGSIGHSRERGQKLQERVYFDKGGHYTTDPNVAEWIIPFGGYKGYAINLLLDVLTGALVSGKSGTSVKDGEDIGGFLLLLDPSKFGTLDAFKAQTDLLVKNILNNPPAEGFSEVRVPGFRAKEFRAKQLNVGEMEIDELVWTKFTELHNKVVS